MQSRQICDAFIQFLFDGYMENKVHRKALNLKCTGCIPGHFSGASILVNSGGTVTNWYEYMPYGEMLMENTTFSYDNPNKYNAKEYDMATGCYY